ncbi:hypothetical protein B0J15DRAFT_523217 [Fusarium solani]|uniref:Uncharacterized protein n=1 Tax=Fusarium solani TaxID=169388 RepID=A0A9P9KUF4_FUSSL|nr:uncharacterized protein B0J15DRAFT_523217 [Fusarium solani]KAH7268739.1 hypothetical protein B0J15DRAFT_523217 [Fusarium solani]
MSHNNTRTSSSLPLIQGGGLSSNKRHEDHNDESQDERQDGSEPAGSGRDDPCQYEPVEAQDGETSTLLDTGPASDCSLNCLPRPILDLRPTSRSHQASSHDQSRGRICSWVKEVTEHGVDIEGFEMDQEMEREWLEMEQRQAKVRSEMEREWLEMEQRQAEVRSEMEREGLKMKRRQAKVRSRIEREGLEMEQRHTRGNFIRTS